MGCVDLVFAGLGWDGSGCRTDVYVALMGGVGDGGWGGWELGVGGTVERGRRGRGQSRAKGKGLLSDYEPQDFDIHKPTLQITERFRQRQQ